MTGGREGAGFEISRWFWAPSRPILLIVIFNFRVGFTDVTDAGGIGSEVRAAIARCLRI